MMRQKRCEYSFKSQFDAVYASIVKIMNEFGLLTSTDYDGMSEYEGHSIQKYL